MSARNRRAKAHAKHGYFCSCGRAVFGNGARAQHFGMHERRGDGHREITHTAFRERFPTAGFNPGDRFYMDWRSTPPPRPGDEVTLVDGGIARVDTAHPDGRGEHRKLTLIYAGRRGQGRDD